MAAAINNLKQKISTTLITVADIAFIVGQCTMNEKKSERDDDMLAVWAEEDEETNNIPLNFIVHTDLADVEQNLATTSFLYGRNLLYTITVALISMHAHLNNGKDRAFLLVRLDTCENHRCVM